MKTFDNLSLIRCYEPLSVIKIWASQREFQSEVVTKEDELATQLSFLSEKMFFSAPAGSKAADNQNSKVFFAGIGILLENQVHENLADKGYSSAIKLCELLSYVPR